MATATKIPNRFAAIIAELDEVSEICESKGDTEACSYIDQVAAQLLASNEESASRPARRRESPRTAELRALARQVKKAGSPAAARALLRVADEMDFDLDLDEPSEPSALDDAGQEPAPSEPAPEMLPCQCECHSAPAPEAPAEPAADLAPPDAGLEPTDEQVEASIKVLSARAAALKAKAKPQTKKANEVVADESVEGALAALDAELAREAEVEVDVAPAPAAATTTNDEQALFAEIEGLEKELQARAKSAKPAKSAAKPAKGADVRRTAQEVARTLEASGQPRAARRIRNLLG